MTKYYTKKDLTKIVKNAHTLKVGREGFYTKEDILSTLEELGLKNEGEELLSPDFKPSLMRSYKWYDSIPIFGAMSHAYNNRGLPEELIKRTTFDTLFDLYQVTSVTAGFVGLGLFVNFF